MTTELMIISVTGIVLTVLSVIILIKTFRLKPDDISERVSSHISEQQNERMQKLEFSISERIRDYNENQIRVLLETKGSTMEKLQRNSTELTDAFGKFQIHMNKSINESSEKTAASLNSNFETLNSKMEARLDKINNKVEERLNDGFEKTNKTFANIIERLSKIDEAQKKIDSLSTDIVSLQDVLTDKKSRGTFGEVQLNNIIRAVFGEKNDKVFELQKKLSNGKMADAVLKLPEPVGVICIDSKFPLENYKRMTEEKKSDISGTKYEKEFKANVKKHITDISEKYIIEGETAGHAIMFLPAEAIFAEINAYHSDLIDYGQSKNIWIASPTTLMSVLSTVQVVLRNIERDKYTSIIHEELNKLGAEFRRYKDRWDSLAKDIQKVSKDVNDIHITSGKIEKRFDQISKVKIEKNQVPGIEEDFISMNEQDEE